MRPLLLVFVLLCLLIMSACQPAPSCQDPLGCARFEKNQPIKVGIVTPRTEAHSCPQAAEAAEAIQAVFAGQKIAGRPISVIEEDSLNDPFTAQQRMNDLAEDPATAGLFYLDCRQDPSQVALTAVDAGIPAFVNQIPVKTERVYTILPPADRLAERLVRLIDAEVEGSLLVSIDPLDGPDELSRRICAYWPEEKGSCSVESYTEDMLISPIRTDALLVLSSRTDSLAHFSEAISESQAVFWFDPTFSQPPNTFNPPMVAGLEDFPGLNASLQYQSTWFAVQAAKLFLEAVHNTAYEQTVTLVLPRKALQDELDHLVLRDCHPETDPSCPDTFDYTLYPIRDGILIINP